MKIQLGEVIQDQVCTIEYFLHPEGGERGMVIVFPGGGYASLAAHEGVPVAKKFVELGFHAAVCMYRIKPVTFPQPLEDARNAVRYTREHAAELGVKPDKIAVAGSSAGGHLVAMVSNMPGSDAARPNATILSYAVLSSKPDNIHRGSYMNLLGTEDESRFAQFSWPEAVNENTPPAFLWHTIPDASVPVGNSIEYTLAMKKFNRDVELHIYPKGPHGLGIGNRPNFEGQFEEVKSWPQLCATFLKNRGW